VNILGRSLKYGLKLEFVNKFFGDKLAGPYLKNKIGKLQSLPKYAGFLMCSLSTTHLRKSAVGILES
jgi:hypothetical protein